MLKLFSSTSGVKGMFCIKISLVMNNLFCSLILNDAREVRYTTSTLFLPVVFRSLWLKSIVKAKHIFVN